MGMIANYQPTTDIELEKIMCLDDVEELQESEDIEICDIDKMWDALHFLLTGKSASEPIEDDLISEAIVGQFNISEEDFISGTKADRVKEIARALQEIDFETYLDKFDMSAFSQNDIYAKLYKGRKQTTKRGLLTTKQAEYQAPEKCGIFSLFCCPGFPKGIPLAHDFACKV